METADYSGLLIDSRSSVVDHGKNEVEEEFAKETFTLFEIKEKKRKMCFDRIMVRRI